MEGILPHSQKESVFTCYLGPKEVLLKLLCFCLFCLALLERVSRNLGYAHGFYGCWGYDHSLLDNHRNLSPWAEKMPRTSFE